MDKLITGFRHFQEHIFWERKEAFERSATGQRPLAMLVTCSDSRVLPDQIIQADPGDLFVHRNAGNLVPTPGGPTGESATIEYAVTALGVTDIIVCGHYHCGAVKALLHPHEASGMPEVSGWLIHAAGTMEVMDRDHANLSGDLQWDRAVEVNVLIQLQNLMQHSVIATGLAAGTLRLHAWVLRFESGDILSYDPHTKLFSPLLDKPVAHPAAPVQPLCCEPPLVASDVLSAPPKVEPTCRWSNIFRCDLPASLVVFFVALPFCLAIAKAAGVPPEAGFIAGIIGGMLVGVIGGSPLQVSGPSVGLVVVLVDVIQRYGLERLGIIVLLAGFFQLLAGSLRMGQWFRAASPSVVTGMLAGIGAVLFSQQFHVMVDDPPAREPWLNLATLPMAVWNSLNGSHEGHPEHQQAAIIGLLTLFILLIWKRIVPPGLRLVPAIFVALIFVIPLVTAFRWPVQRVEFSGLASAIRWPDREVLISILSEVSVWFAAAVVALVASAESLLSAAAVDRMHCGPRTRYDRELVAQGIGNMACGLLGALPIAGGIARSAANIQAGAKSRYSTIFHATWLIAFVLLFPETLQLIPTAALAAILVLTGIKLIESHAFHTLWKESRTEGVICLSTAIAVIVVGLLPGVILGVALSLAKLIHTFSRLRIRRRANLISGTTTFVLEGSATFIRLPKLAAALEKVPDGDTLHLDIRRLSYIDHACMTLLINWEKQHRESGGKLTLDWETLRMRFLSACPRPRVA